MINENQERREIDLQVRESDQKKKDLKEFKKRRKMSKQLGNSPDPLKLINNYGADAVRVGLMLSSSAGNEIGRASCRERV